jgi:hypothetical protein
MIRKWCIPLTTLALVFGSMLAAGSASATAMAPHPGASHFTPGGLMIRPAGHVAGSAKAHLNQDESTNWSGYAVTGANGAFHSISASWVEPTGTCTSRSAQYSSFWVGLDGFNSNSVEQTGTDVDCNGRTPVYYGWYETYPNPSYNFGDAISAGDTISASATYEGSNKYLLSLSDKTKGWTTTTTQTVSGAPRSSAEVIIEAPCCTSSGGILPLADFGTINVSDSIVDGAAIGTLDPAEIIMIDSSGRDKDTVSALSSNENFSATWVRAS